MALNPDPRLVSAIRRYVPLPYRPLALATAFTESGGRLNAVGDNGQSFGPFQEYTGGRGAGLTPAQREDPVGATQRFAKELLQYASQGYRGPELAYRTQRPADHSGYVAKVSQYLPDARRILGGALGGALPQGPPRTGPGRSLGGAVSPAALPGLGRYLKQSESAVLMGQMPGDVAGLLGSLDTAPAPLPPVPGRNLPKLGGALGAFNGDPLGVKEKVIGTPYSGTHTLGNWESDDAVDLAAPVGTPVYALANGKIGTQFGSLGEGGRFAGLRLHLLAPGNEFYYAHLSRFAPGIRPGATVRRGQLLGYSGEANGVGHLHLGVRNGNALKVLGL